MRKFLFLAAGSGLVCAAALFTSSCSQSKAVEVAIPSDNVATVAVAKATVGDMARDLVLTAEFEPYQEIDVMAKVAGYVKQIHVDIGDQVRQGQLLAVLEIPEMNDDMAKADASIEHDNAEVARARDELRRAESAHDMAHLTYTRLASVSQTRPGLVAQEEIDDAHSRDLVAEAQISAAKSALAAAQQQVKEAQAEQNRVKTLYNYTFVTAPFSGVITKRYADTGSMIQAGIASQTQAMPLVRLSQNSLLRLILPAPESVVSRIHVGTPVEVRVPSLGRSFTGRVARFADKVQTDTRTMATEVDVPNPSLVLVPGMYAEAVLKLDERAKALSVPVTAIAGSDSQPAVYRVDSRNRIEERPVTTGIQTATRVEIRSGLRLGDLVIIGNRSELKPGQQVSPKITEMAPAKGDDN